MPWTNLGNAPWTGRDSARVFRHRGWMYLSNGWNSSISPVDSRDLWYGAKPTSWTLRNGATPYDKYSPIFDYQDAIVAVAGTQWRSTDGGANFTSIGATPWAGDQYPFSEVLVFNGKMVRIGTNGIHDSDDATDINAWTSRAASVPWASPGFYGQFQCIAFEDRIVVIGGGLIGASVPPETGWPNESSKAWIWLIDQNYNIELVTDNAPFGALWWSGLGVHLGALYLSCGMCNHFRNPLAPSTGNVGETFRVKSIADMKRNAWERLPDVVTPRHGPSLISDRGQLLMLGGSKNNGDGHSVVNEVLALS